MANLIRNGFNHVRDYFSAEDVRKLDADRRYWARLVNGLSNSSQEDSTYKINHSVRDQRMFRALPLVLLALTPAALGISSPFYPKLKAGYFSAVGAAVTIGTGIYHYYSNRRRSQQIQTNIDDLIAIDALDEEL